MDYPPPSKMGVSNCAMMSVGSSVRGGKEWLSGIRGQRSEIRDQEIMVNNQ